MTGVLERRWKVIGKKTGQFEIIGWSSNDFPGYVTVGHREQMWKQRISDSG